MKLPLTRLALVLSALFALSAQMHAAGSAPDLPGPEARATLIDLAERYSKPVPQPPLAASVVNPFNPAAFGMPDPEELRAIAAAAAAEASANAQAKPATDRDFLSIIASRVTPSGTLILRGEPLLIFGKQRLRVGDRLNVSYDGTDYTVELTAIGRTTFTLRLNNEEITRPIKPAKSP